MEALPRVCYLRFMGLDPGMFQTRNHKALGSNSEVGYPEKWFSDEH